MIKRWRGLPGGLVLLGFHSIILTIVTGMVMSAIFSSRSSDNRQSLFTRHGGIFFYDWRDEERVFDAAGEPLPDSAAASVRADALRLFGYSFGTTWEPDANRPGLRWRNAADWRWRNINGFIRVDKREKTWFYLPDECVMALYGEDGSLLGKLGPDGFHEGNARMRGFEEGLRPVSTSGTPAPYRSVLVVDTLSIYRLSLDPPEILDSMTAPAGRRSTIDFNHFHLGRSQPVAWNADYFGWVTDTGIILCQAAQLPVNRADRRFETDRILLPRDLWSDTKGSNYYQVFLGLGPGKILADTAAFRIDDRILFANRLTGEILSDSRTGQAPRRGDSRETTAALVGGGLFSLQPMPLPFLASAAAFYVFCGKEPATRAERADQLLKPFMKEPNARRAAFWGGAWLLPVHLLGGLAGWLAARRAGANPEAVLFWMILGLVTGLVPALLLFLFRGPKRPVAAPRGRPHSELLSDR